MNLAAFMSWWQARAPRERILVAVVVIAAILGLGDVLVTAPMERRLRVRRDELETLRAQGTQQAALSGQNGPQIQAARAEEAQLHERVAVAQHTLDEMHRDADQAARLPEVLRSVVSAVGSTRLLMLDLTGTGEAIDGESGAHLYRLPITIKVSGSWQELATLMAQLDRDAKALQWSLLSLDASGWPSIQLTIRAHVLSRHAQWGANS